MGNKFLPDYIEDKQNKFLAPDPVVENYIDNEKSNTLGDDIVFNNAQSAPSLNMTRYQKELEIYKQQRTQAHTVPQINHGLANGQTPEEEEAFREELLNPENGYNYYLGEVRSNDANNALSEDQVKEIAAGMYARSLIAKAGDGVGYTEQAMNIASLVLFPTETATLTGMFPDQTKDTLLDPAQFVKKFSEGYKDLPPEQKVLVAREIFDRAQTATDNEIQQITMMLDLIGSDEVDLGSAQFNYGMDRLDAITLGVAGVATGAAILKGRKGVNALKSLKSAEEASKITEAAIASDKVGSALGVNKLDAANSADINKVPGILDGADPKLAHDINALWQKQDEMIDSISRFQQEGLGIDDAQRTALAEHAAKKAAEDMEKNGLNVINSAGRVEGNKVFTTVTTRDSSGAEHVYNSDRFLTTDDQSGLFKVDNLNPVLAKITSPNYFFGKDRDVLVEAYERIGYQSAGIASVLARNFNTVTKGMNRQSLDKLNTVLHMGNKSGEVYNVNQLTTTGVNGIVLSNKEAIAYAGTRKLFDDLYVLEDLAATKQFIAQGLKVIKSKASQQGGAAQSILAKPYEKYADGVNAFTKDLYDYVKFSDVIGDPKLMIKPSKDDIKKMYDQGYVLARATKDENNLFEVMGTRTVWSFVRRDEIGEIKGGILPYRQGYVPQIGEKEYFFAKIKDTMNIEGKDEASVGKTLATFESKLDAENWATKYNEELVASGEKPLDISILGDREMEDALVSADSIKRMGGLFGGRRSSREIPHVVGENEQARTFTNVYEAMQRNISHISRRLPTSEYRLGIERIWMNSAAQHIDDLKIRNYSFNEAVALLDNPDLKINPLIKTKLKESANQIQFMNNVATREEEAMMAQMVGIGNALEKMHAKGPAKFFYEHKSLDPISAVKGGTFHLVLGTFNMAQYFIQASGATIAMSIAPRHAAKVLPRLPAYTALDNIADYKTRIEAAKTWDKWGKRVGILGKNDNFVDDYIAWNSTGIREGIIRNNVDAANMYGGLPVGGVTTQRVLGIASDVSTAPYSAGELVNARISYFTALNEMRAAKGGAALTDNELQQVSARAEKFRLNMNKANKAAYQKSFWAVTTQFMSVNFRFAEAMLGRSLSAQDKWQLLAGQGLLFGTLGIPAADYAARNMLDAFGYSADEMPPQMYNEVREGMIGLALDYADMDNVDVVRRTALGEGFAQQVLGLAADENTPLLLLAGVSAVPGSRAIELTQAIANSTKMLKSVDELSPAAVAIQAKYLADYLMDLPSSTRKAAFAWEAYNNRMFKNKDGKPVIFNDNNPLEDVMMAVGFNSKDMMDFYAAQQANYDMIQRKKDATKQLIRSFNALNNAVEEHDNDTVVAVQMFTSGLMSSFSMEDRAEIWKAIQDQAAMDSDPQLRLIVNNLKNANSEFMDAANNLSNLMLNHAENVGEPQ